MEAMMVWKAESRCAVLIWRAALLLLFAHEKKYALPLDSFRFFLITHEAEYDASLTGVGFLLFLLVNGQRSSLIACGQVTFPFDCLQDSGYQNTCEFIAVLLAVLGLAQLGIRDVSIRLCGDSTTSLSWGTDGHFTGHLSRRASLVYILASSLFNIVATESVHIPGELNVVCDALSRQRATAASYGIDYRLLTDFAPTSSLFHLLSLVDPTLPSPMETEDSFRLFWSTANSLLIALSLESTLTATPS